MLDNFLKFYGEERPAFDSVEGMLESVDLYSNTYPSHYRRVATKCGTVQALD